MIPDKELEDELELELDDEVVEDEEVTDEETAEDEEAPQVNEDVAAAKGNRQDADVTSERKPGRAETRIQALANSRKAAEERASNAERELQELRAAQQNAQNTQQLQYQQQQEQERLRQQWDNSGPEERMAMMLQQAEIRNQRMNQMQQMQLADTTDKLHFNNMVGSDPIAAKYRNEVETRLSALRNGGLNATREDVYKHLLGEKLMAKRASAAKTQTAKGKANIKKQTVPARSSRGDREGGRPSDSEAAARYKRLENMQI